VRIEQLGEQAHEYVDAVLQRTKHVYLERTYKIQGPFQSSMDFLSKYAARTGKLLKGGEPDINAVAKMVLNDWLRGKIPYFVSPPLPDSADPPKPHVADKPHELQIRQKLSTIRVQSEFSSDPCPAQPLQAEDDVVDWDQLYSSVKAEEAVQLPALKGPYKPKQPQEDEEPAVPAAGLSRKRAKQEETAAQSDEASASSTSSSVPTKTKEKRMTTLKTKLASRNFYKTANVKNRSSRRAKQAP